MSLTLLARFGKHAIVGNTIGSTFLYSADDEAAWDTFDRPHVTSKPFVRQIVAAAGLDATWRQIEMQPVKHGQHSAVCFFDPGERPVSPAKPKWFVYQP